MSDLHNLSRKTSTHELENLQPRSSPVLHSKALGFHSPSSNAPPGLAHRPEVWRHKLSSKSRERRPDRSCLPLCLHPLFCCSCRCPCHCPFLSPRLCWNLYPHFFHRFASVQCRPAAVRHS